MKNEVKIDDYKCSCGMVMESAEQLNGQPGQVPGNTSIMICTNCYALHQWMDGKLEPLPDERYQWIRRSPRNWFNLQLAIDNLKRAKVIKN